MAGHQDPVDEEQLYEELRELRRRGLKAARELPFPALNAFAERRPAAKRDGTQVAGVEEALRAAIGRLGPGPLGQAARLTFGLEAGTRGMPASARRRQAAAVFGLEPETFRKQPEQDLLRELAHELCRLTESRDTRPTAPDPAIGDSAASLLQRFESYYQLWTPLSALRNDLDAALELHQRSPASDNWQEYADYSLVHYIGFSVLLNVFFVEYGGLWILGDAAAEDAVAGAIYDICQSTPLSERDESWLRMTWESDPHGELHSLLGLLEDSGTGTALLLEWRAWAIDCRCHADSADDCAVHRVINGCAIYMEIVDASWRETPGGVSQRSSRASPNTASPS